jgi:hypothetical protein
MPDYQCPVAARNAQARGGFMELLRGQGEPNDTQGLQAKDAVSLVDAVDAWLEGCICPIDVRPEHSVIAWPPNGASVI